MGTTYTQNGINFTLNADVVAPFSGKYTNAENYDASTGLYNVNSAKLTNLGILPSINSVDIDWNNVDLGNSYYINTTGELLSYISGLMQLVEYYEKPQRVIVTYDSTSYYKAVFDVYKTVNINNTNIPLVKKVSLTGKNSFAKLDARYVPTIHDSNITWKESTTTNSFIALTAEQHQNEGDTHAIVKSNICYIRPNDVINEITKENNYVSQKIKAYTDIQIYDDANNAYAFKYIDVVILEGSISNISYYPLNSAETKNVDVSGGEITLQCKLTHDKFNLTADDCNHTIQSGITWITYEKKTLSKTESDAGLYTFTFNVSASELKDAREAVITLNTIITDGTTKTIKYKINQDGLGEIITGVNSGVANNEITIYTNGTPNNYQLAPSLIKS